MEACSKNMPTRPGTCITVGECTHAYFPSRLAKPNPRCRISTISTAMNYVSQSGAVSLARFGKSRDENRERGELRQARRSNLSSREPQESRRSRTRPRPSPTSSSPNHLPILRPFPPSPIPSLARIVQVHARRSRTGAPDTEAGARGRYLQHVFPAKFL